MNKLFSILAIFTMLNFGFVSNSFSQDPGTDTTVQTENEVDTSITEKPVEAEEAVEDDPEAAGADAGEDKVKEEAKKGFIKQ